MTAEQERQLMLLVSAYGDARAGEAHTVHTATSEQDLEAADAEVAEKYNKLVKYVHSLVMDK